MRFSSVQVLLSIVLVACDGARDASDGDARVEDAHAQDADAPHDAGEDASVLDAGDASAPYVRGARVPWVEYEAELGATNAQIVGPSRMLGTHAGEASGRRAVVLDAQGEYVAWRTTRAANAIVVRHSIPDAPGGGGLQATLSLYVDGQKRRTLALSSKEAWVYGGDATQVNAPSAGTPRRIYTEASALLDFTIPAGAEVRLVKDAGDAAAYYAIDFVDLELAADPIPRPAGYIAITDGGHPWQPAVANDGQPDDAAINQCIQAALSGQYQGVYFPPGVFDHTNKILVHGTTIQGAGLWHTRLRNGDLAERSDYGSTGFVIDGHGARFRDLAVFGSTDGLRDQGGKAWANSSYDDALIENVWVENVQCAYWVGGNAPSNRLVIRNSRFRNTGADAVNLCNGTRDSVLEDNHARNTGDDAFAIWAAKDLYPHPTENNVIRHCSVQITWRAAGFAVYGGRNNRIEDGVVADTLTYPGITLSTEFDPYPLESVTVERVTLERTGGAYWGGQHFGAIWVRGDQNPTNGISVRDVEIRDATYQGIVLETVGAGRLTNVLFENVSVISPGTFGLHVRGGAQGGAAFTGVTVSGAGTGGLLDETGGSFTLTRTSSSGF